MFTIRGAFTDRYVGTTSTFNRESGLTVSSPSYWTPSLSLATQTRFTPRLSLNAGYAYNFQGRTLAELTGKGVAFDDVIGDTQNVDVSLNYHFMPDRLVGSVAYQHTFYGDRSEVFADPGSNLLQSRAGDLFSVTLRYLFR
jgi:hypothetical protein